MSGSRPKYLALLCACLLATNSSHAIAAPSKNKDLDERTRHYDADTAKGKEDIEKLAGVSQNKAVTLDLLKTRAELLVELRAQVQAMYADLSDLNTEIMKY